MPSAEPSWIAAKCPRSWKGRWKLMNPILEAVERARGAAGKVPVFGIIERKGRVWVQPVEDVSAETLLDATVRKVRRGSLVYTDKYKKL